MCVGFNVQVYDDTFRWAAQPIHTLQYAQLGNVYALVMSLDTFQDVQDVSGVCRSSKEATLHRAVRWIRN